MASYTTEREGQIEFYETFIPRVDPDLDLDEILAHMTQSAVKSHNGPADRLQSVGGACR